MTAPQRVEDNGLRSGTRDPHQMGHITSNVGWSTIDIELSGDLIFVQSDWKYQWLTRQPATPWTYRQQRDFHDDLDRLVWREWSFRVFLQTGGTSSFADRTHGLTIPVNFDVRMVAYNQHWTVIVTKIHKNVQSPISSVQWKQRTITLDSKDMEIKTTSPPNYPQYAASHEFGHAIGNTWVLGRGDEYRSSSPHYQDKFAIMNAGNELRKRYFRTLIEELKIMMPNTTFSVAKPVQ